ncbi:transcriptional regulator [Noviherbaspirillum suwonense]|jgi:DNA-binding transcriptional regulator YdaS (Cro superfamily)|uniref:Antitoxin of toxin-antitoxin system, YdaS/YdaT n=1 Tax=Noviherbaspirillum suwonense TaxID=1224511 RepID=A0ABY1QJM8_9BURK|nr:Putative antitoxin of toxin-antitoxin system, YdaS/YdaT [Noviherbaspirillum suwonense]
MDTKTLSPIEKAVGLAGGTANLAKSCGVTQQAVYKWLKSGHPPVERCVAIEQAVRGRVSRFDLLPADFCSAPLTKARK